MLGNLSDLTKNLFEPEKRRLAGIISDLNTRNKELTKIKVDGFMFAGKLYIPSDMPTTIMSSGQAKVILHHSLNREMELWLRDQTIVQEDQALIKQMLFRLLKGCSTLHQARNTLPDCFVNLVQGFNTLPRTDSVAYTLEGDERALRQFNKILPRMELYSATRFFY